MAKILQKNGVYARVGGGPLNACRLKSISFFNEEDAVLPTQWQKVVNIFTVPQISKEPSILDKNEILSQKLPKFCLFFMYKTESIIFLLKIADFRM